MMAAKTVVQMMILMKLDVVRNFGSFILYKKPLGYRNLLSFRLETHILVESTVCVSSIDKGLLNFIPFERLQLSV